MRPTGGKRSEAHCHAGPRPSLPPIMASSPRATLAASSTFLTAAAARTLARQPAALRPTSASAASLGRSSCVEAGTAGQQGGGCEAICIARVRQRRTHGVLRGTLPPWHKHILRCWEQSRPPWNNTHPVAPTPCAAAPFPAAAAARASSISWPCFAASSCTAAYASRTSGRAQRHHSSQQVGWVGKAPTSREHADNAARLTLTWVGAGGGAG